MDVLENIKKTTAYLEKQANKKINTAKLDLKRVNYKNKLSAIYKEIGQYVYTCKNSHSEFSSKKFDELCAEADLIKDKIKGIEKQILDIKKVTPQKSQQFQQAKQSKCSLEALAYQRLNKKENDLKLIKTEEGVKFIKLCPECNSVNPPEAIVCFNCSHKFKKIEEK